MRWPTPDRLQDPTLFAVPPGSSVRLEPDDEGDPRGAAWLVDSLVTVARTLKAARGWMDHSDATARSTDPAALKYTDGRADSTADDRADQAADEGYDLSSPGAVIVPTRPNTADAPKVTPRRRPAPRRTPADSLLNVTQVPGSQADAPNAAAPDDSDSLAERPRHTGSPQSEVRPRRTVALPDGTSLESHTYDSLVEGRSHQDDS